jgi:hypothetical protein
MFDSIITQSKHINSYQIYQHLLPDAKGIQVVLEAGINVVCWNCFLQLKSWSTTDSIRSLININFLIVALVLNEKQKA